MEPVPRGGALWRGRLGFRCADVVEAVPFPAHQARLHVDLLDGGVDDGAVGRAAELGEVAADRVERGDVGDVVGRDLELVQVGAQAVAALERCDDLIARVHDHVFALSEAEFEDASRATR